MEYKLMHDLLNFCDDLFQQKKIVNRMLSLPSDIYDKDTVKILKIMRSLNDSERLSTFKNVSSYIKFNKISIDLETYFWDTDEEEEDLEILSETFLKEKEFEYNESVIKEALSEYKDSGDISYLKDLDLARNSGNDIVKNIRDAVDETVEKFIKIKNKEETNSIKLSNKFLATNLITKGFEEGEFIIIAARPGVGKTAFAIALMNDITKQGKKALFISLEMTSTEIISRMINAKTNISNNIIKSNNKFTDEVLDEIKKASQEIVKQPISIIEDPVESFIELKDVIKEAHRKEKIDIVFIDYLGLIESYNNEKQFDPRISISRISRGIKLLAKELKIPIIALQQVNRSVSTRSNSKKKEENKDASYGELQLTDLRDSGSLEQDANKVLLLWNKQPETDKEKEDERNSIYNLIVSVAKNRSGQANQKILFRFDKSVQRIREIEWMTKPASFEDYRGNKK